MSFTLDMDGLLTRIQALNATIPGIRQSYSYKDYAQKPPGVPNKNAAYAYVGFPGTDGTGLQYGASGMDLSEYIVEVPIYIVVAGESNPDRAAGWIAQYYAGVVETYRDHMQLSLNGSAFITAGVALFEQRAAIVRGIPDRVGFDGFYILRLVLTCHIKGAHTNAP